jgi:hypothetical protein
VPLPMVHLAVAVRLCEAWRREASPAFLLGTLAPDAIHMRPETTREDKSRVHLHAAITKDGLLAVRRLYEALIAADPALQDLALGYAVHLLTDALWVERVFYPFRAALGLPQEEERKIYYQETDEVDRLLFEGAPWRPSVWRALAAAQPADVPGLLSADEIGRWRDRTLAWFDDLPAAPAPPRYLTYARILAFVGETAAAITEEVAEWGLVGDG